MRTKLAMVAVVLLAFGGYAGISHALTKPTTTIPAFVGDSNVLLATGYLSKQFFVRNDSYPFVVVDRVGAGIRTSDCAAGTTTCATYDSWCTRMAAVRSKVQPDVYVVDLGINDTLAPGTATTPGYAAYGQKIDHFLGLANPHPGWMATFSGGVHYEPFGYAAWSELVTKALESRYGSS
jgi:hypothetical protein